MRVGSREPTGTEIKNFLLFSTGRGAFLKLNLGTQINQEGTQTEEQATPHLPRPGLSSGYPAETVLLSCPDQSHKLQGRNPSLKGCDFKKALAGASTFNEFVWITCVDFRAGAWDPV